MSKEVIDAFAVLKHSRNADSEKENCRNRKIGCDNASKQKNKMPKIDDVNACRDKSFQNS